MPEFSIGDSFLSSGLVLLVVGGILAYLRRIPGMIWWQIRSRLVLTLQIDKSNTFYIWVENWLASQQYLKACRNLMASCVREDGDAPYSGNKEAEAGGRDESPWRIMVTPAPGDHFFWYKGHPVWMRKEREKLKAEGMILGLFETMALTFLTRDRGVVREFLKEVRDFNVPPGDNRLAVYVAQWTSWRVQSLVPPRSPETVVLADGLLQSLIEDIELFLRSEDWYFKHAIPYRRGYLLFGPPGNGKSASVLALASHLHKDVYILTVNDSMTDDRFTELILGVPANAILLMEDVDQALEHQADGKDNSTNKLTRSCLLNALDGIAAPTGRILFMTTNFVDRLDEALIRPGRADVSVHIDAPTERQMDTYLARFFDDDHTASEIKARLNGRNSMADLQAEVIREVWGGQGGIHA